MFGVSNSGGKGPGGKDAGPPKGLPYAIVEVQPGINKFLNASIDKVWDLRSWL